MLDHTQLSHPQELVKALTRSPPRPLCLFHKIPVVIKQSLTLDYCLDLSFLFPKARLDIPLCTESLRSTLLSFFKYHSGQCGPLVLNELVDLLGMILYRRWKPFANGQAGVEGSHSMFPEASRVWKL